MSDRISSLRLDRTTSAEQLQAFLDKGGDRTKVRAETNSDGSVTLFATDRATGWWGRLTGLSRERETARAALDEWFRFQFGPDLSPEAKQVLDGRVGAGEVNVGIVSKLAIAEVSRLAGESRKLARESTPQPYQPILPREEVIPKPPDGNIQTPSVVTLGGIDYIIGDQLGNGADAVVREGVSKTGEKVAIKRLINGDSEIKRSQEIEREFRVHERAMNTGQDVSHIVGLKGATTGPNGRIDGIVLEHMPGGSAKQLLERLRTAEDQKLIKPEEARLIRLTIAKDMAMGLTQVHDAPGLLHYDVKPANFLISGDGVVKISDFGTTRPKEEMRGSPLGKATMGYMSPEALNNASRIAELEEQIGQLQEKSTRLGSTMEALSTLRESEKLQREIDAMSVDTKTDVFSLGLSLADVFEGTQLANSKRGATKSIEALGRGSDAERDAVFGDLGVTGNSPEHRLIRAMLSGDAEKRPTAQDVLGSPPFDDPRIGSPETRKLLLKVALGELGAQQGDGHQ